MKPTDNLCVQKMTVQPITSWHESEEDNVVLKPHAPETLSSTASNRRDVYMYSFKEINILDSTEMIHDHVWSSS